MVQMNIMTLEQSIIRQRLRSLPNPPYAFILLVLCFTPLIFWPPFFRSWLYSTLAMSKIFANRSWPISGPRPWGLVLWDRTHTHSVFIATSFLPVGAPLLMFFLLDLNGVWRTLPQHSEAGWRWQRSRYRGKGRSTGSRSGSLRAHLRRCSGPRASRTGRPRSLRCMEDTSSISMTSWHNR